MDDVVERSIDTGAACAVARADAGLRAAVDTLVTCDEQTVADALERRVLEALARAWSRGWLPTELVRHVRRRDAATSDLAALAVAADLARHDQRTVHPRWRTLCDEAGAVATEPSGWLLEFTWRAAGGWPAAITAALVTLAETRWLPALAMIVPPPGDDDLPGRREAAANAAAWLAAANGDAPDLVRIRRLLAQAESTTFPAEAETFTAKAHEIAARLSIDLATQIGASTHRPVIVRFPVEDPYSAQKAQLLHAAASPSGCRVVRHTRFGMCSVVGFAADVLAAEMLFTSLLLQSQTELGAITMRSAPGSRERTRGFRGSFLTGYAHRVFERLSTVSAAVATEHSSDGRDLPVLVQRRQQVDDVVASTFSTRTERRREIDGTAWREGFAAAARADLGGASLRADRRELGRSA